MFDTTSFFSKQWSEELKHVFSHSKIPLNVHASITQTQFFIIKIYFCTIKYTVIVQGTNEFIIEAFKVQHADCRPFSPLLLIFIIECALPRFVNSLGFCLCKLLNLLKLFHQAVAVICEIKKVYAFKRTNPSVLCLLGFVWVE